MKLQAASVSATMGFHWKFLLNLKPCKISSNFIISTSRDANMQLYQRILSGKSSNYESILFWFLPLTPPTTPYPCLLIPRHNISIHRKTEIWVKLSYLGWTTATHPWSISFHILYIYINMSALSVGHTRANCKFIAFGCPSHRTWHNERAHLIFWFIAWKLRKVLSIHSEKFFLISLYQSDSNCYTYQIDFEPNGIPVGSKLIGK